MMLVTIRMKMFFKGIYLIFLFFVLAASLIPDVQADTNAVTTLNLAFIGYANGAVGFSFTPSTNLAITRVGYFDNGEVAPVISFWSSTNYVFASFQLAPGTASYATTYSNINLQLLAGQRYTITLKDGTNPVLFNSYTNPQIAPQISNYAMQIYLFGTGGFTDYGSNYYLAGPNFSYTNLTGTVLVPSLKITRTNNSNAIVSWPTTPAGFILQQSSLLSANNWTTSTNSVSNVNGSNQISSPIIGNKFFRLLHP